jgi:hypothetical protein
MTKPHAIIKKRAATALKGLSEHILEAHDTYASYLRFYSRIKK